MSALLQAIRANVNRYLTEWRSGNATADERYLSEATRLRAEHGDECYQEAARQLERES